MVVFGQSVDSISFFFASNSSTMSLFDLKKMEGFLSEVKKNNWEINSVNGFCDTTGSFDLNQRLASKRIAAVVSKFDNKESFQKNVFGENYTDKSHFLNSKESNRRVDVIYTIQEIEEVVSAKMKLENSFDRFLKDSTLNDQLIELTVLFVPGQPFFLQESAEELQTLHLFLIKNPKVKAEIRGHVCCADEYLLSFKRAKAVYDYLYEGGVSPKRMTYEGYSNTQPAVSPEITEADKKRNRRVDVIFTKIP